MTSQYDLVCNGYEAGGGSIRSNKPEILKAVYKVMGNTDEETAEKDWTYPRSFYFWNTTSWRYCSWGGKKRHEFNW